MNIIDVFQSFQTQEQAVEYLENIRWRGEPVCPYCGSRDVGRHASGDRANARWQCQRCKRAFAATVGTLFHGTHVPLRDWFLVLALMLNVKKSASAYQIARDIGKRRATVWSMMHRIRTAMATDPEQSRLLHGIVETDQTYVGGKPRKGDRRDGDKPDKRGRGTKNAAVIGKNAAVIGAVERHSRAVAKVAELGDLSAKDSKFDARFSILSTDKYSSCNAVGRSMVHAVINQSIQYAHFSVHTNSIGVFWGLVKRAWYGSHHHYNSPNAGDSFTRSVDVFAGARA